MVRGVFHDGGEKSILSLMVIIIFVYPIEQFKPEVFLLWGNMPHITIVRAYLDSTIYPDCISRLWSSHTLFLIVVDLVLFCRPSNCVPVSFFYLTYWILL